MVKTLEIILSWLKKKMNILILAGLYCIIYGNFTNKADFINMGIGIFIAVIYYTLTLDKNDY